MLLITKISNKQIYAVLLCFSLILLTSCYHFYTKTETIKNAQKERDKEHKNLIIQDSGSIVKVLHRDSNYQKADEIYRFDKEGNQVTSTFITSCDSCLQKNLKHLFKIINWKQLNDSTYYSGKKLLLVFPTLHACSIIHFKTRDQMAMTILRAALRNFRQ